MTATQQPPVSPASPPGQPCASCGAALAADQRYCLSCGTRRGEPRVASNSPAPISAAPAAPQPARSADVSPLAAVIGIALLGGMLLIGVLIGRGGADDPAPAPIVQVGDPAPATPDANGGKESAVVTSEWPEGTNGFTIQLTTVTKDGATTDSVDTAKQQAVSDGAADAAVLDSDLYASMPPGNFVIYSGVYTDRRSAEVALKGLRASFPSAAVIEVSSDDQPSASAGGGSKPPASSADPPTTTPTAPAQGTGTAPLGTAPDVAAGAGGENEATPADTK